MENPKFNYFYEMFKKEFRNNASELLKSRLSDDVLEIIELFDVYLNPELTKEESLQYFDKSLFEVCSNYISLSNSSITILPNNSFELLNLILENIENNFYQNSFLLSLQFIFQDYFKLLDKGYPMLFTTEIDIIPSLQITFDSNYKMTQFDALNMELIEQDKTMLRILSLEKNNQFGPIPNVEYIYRKDI